MFRTLASISLLPLMVACGSGGAVASNVQPDPMPATVDTDPAAAVTVVITGADGTPIGEAEVRPGPHGMVIRVHAEGVPAGWHGAHLHQVGDCSDHAEGFKRSGSHINISGAEHGLLNPAGYHTGADFPNLHASQSDLLVGELFAGGLRLDQAMDEDGFALIIHANEDDHITQPIGGAGARLACAAFR